MSDLTDDELATQGRAVATLMIGGIEGCMATNEVMVNAIGVIIEATFMGLPLCDQHRLEEFDSWVAYIRARMAEAQQTKGMTRQ